MRVLLVLLIAMTVLARPLQGQAVLRGRVVSDSGKAPVAGAIVNILGRPETVRTDAAGRFVLAGLPGGVHSLRIRAIGYEQFELEAEIGATDTVDVEFRLKPVAVRLPSLEVTAPATPRRSASMELFERRRQLGFGSFMDRADLERFESQPASVPLRQLAGIRLTPRCGGKGFVAVSGRGGDQRPRCGGGLYPPGCYLAIFVNGMRVWDPSMDDPPDVDEFFARDLQAVEVYRGPGELPIDLQQTGTSCGAIVFWTRTGESPEPAAARPPAPR
jgi:hypothetical protein